MFDAGMLTNVNFTHGVYTVNMKGVPVKGRLDDVGEADGWRCWLCDEAVDPDMSVNDDRGPSIDSMTTQRKAKGKGTESIFGTERLAHRGCNTKKGAVAPIVQWPNAVAAAEWLVDRLSRLAPSLHVQSRIQAGGGQYLVVLTS